MVIPGYIRGAGKSGSGIANTEPSKPSWKWVSSDPIIRLMISPLQAGPSNFQAQ